MSVATDIAQVTTYLQDIEAYEHLGKWNPDQNASCAQKLVEADKQIKQAFGMTTFNCWSLSP